LPHIRQWRFGTTGIGIATTIQIRLRQRIGFQRLLVVLGIDQYDFQTRIGRLEFESLRRREVHSQQRKMRQHGSRDSDSQKAILEKRLHAKDRQYK
jgi:hypothetical protein